MRRLRRVSVIVGNKVILCFGYLVVACKLGGISVNNIELVYNLNYLRNY